MNLPVIQRCPLISMSVNQRVYSIVRTGITCKKIFCYMRDSACRWFIVENAKIFRSQAKKVVLFPESGRVKVFLSPTRPHKSNMYESKYFLFQKTHTQTKKIILANLFVRIKVFFSSNNKRWGSLFLNKENCYQSSFLSVNFVQKIQLN